MKRLTYLVAVLVAIVSVGSAYAATDMPKRGDVVGSTPDTYNAGWVTGTSQDGGSKGQSIKLGDNSVDASSFAYYSFRGFWDMQLTSITKIRASFLTPSTTINAGASPRFSLEVVNPGEPELAGYEGTGVSDVIYLDPATCSDPASGGWRHADFTGDLTNCTITDSNGTAYMSDGVTSAWSKLVSDPYYAGATLYFMYLIQDSTTGFNYVDRIQLGNALFTKS